MEAFLTLLINKKQFALPVEELERVFPALAVQPLPAAEGRFYGFFNFAGGLIPVFDMAYALTGERLPPRPSCPLVLARYAKRHFAFFASGIQEVTLAPAPDCTVLSPMRMLTPHEAKFVNQFGTKAGG